MDAGDSEFFRQVVLLATADFIFSYLAFKFAEKHRGCMESTYCTFLFIVFLVFTKIYLYNIVHVGSEMKCVLLV